MPGVVDIIRARFAPADDAECAIDTAAAANKKTTRRRHRRQAKKTRRHR